MIRYLLKKHNMGTASKKPRAMRSRRSGVKTKKLIDKNLGILSKLKS